MTAGEICNIWKMNAGISNVNEKHDKKEQSISLWHTRFMHFIWMTNIEDKILLSHCIVHENILTLEIKVHSGKSY